MQCNKSHGSARRPRIGRYAKQASQAEAIKVNSFNVRLIDKVNHERPPLRRDDAGDVDGVTGDDDDEFEMMLRSSIGGKREKEGGEGRAVADNFPGEIPPHDRWRIGDGAT